MALYKPFDVSVKDLIEELPDGWPALAGGWKPRQLRLIDADVATLTAAADKVFWLEEDAEPWLLDLEPEVSFKPDTPEKLHLYSAALSRRHKLRVRTVVLLLRREADGAHLSGVYRQRFADEPEDYVIFRYRVVRVWQVPVEALLTGGLGTLPLAPLTDEAAPRLEEVVRRIDQRVRVETPPEVADKLRLASLILMGLRYASEQALELWKGVTQMEESTTYQYILEQGKKRGRDEGRAEGRAQGRAEEARKLLLKLGAKHLGVPAPAIRATLEALTEVSQLEALVEQVHDVKSWDDLLTNSSP